MFEGISISFLLSTAGGILVSVLLIRHRNLIATLVQGLLGTSVIRDTGNPYVYAVVGWMLIVFYVIQLILAFIT